MSKLYVVVSPPFTGRSDIVQSFIDIADENVQVVEESAIIKGQFMEPVPRTQDFRYALIAVMVRSHLIKNRDVVVVTDDLSIEGLVLWRKMTREHNAKCIIVLLDADQEMAMCRIDKLNVSNDAKNQTVNEVAYQFKKYDDIHSLFSNKLNTINRDLADLVILGNWIESQED